MNYLYTLKFTNQFGTKDILHLHFGWNYLKLMKRNERLLIINNTK